MCCLYTSCGRCISASASRPELQTNRGGPGPWRMGHGGGARPRASPASPQPQLLPIPERSRSASTVVVAWQLVSRHASTSPEHARRARRLFRQHVAYTLVYHNDGKMFVDVERVPPAPGGGAGSDTAGAAAAPSTSRMSSARTSDVATSLTCSR